MDRVTYHKETHPELIEAAKAAYREAVPAVPAGFGRRHAGHDGQTGSLSDLAKTVRSADQRAA